jgi:excisionase family DNA binding protein
VTPELPTGQLPRLHSVASVMDRLNLGRSKVFELFERGELRRIKVGRRRLTTEAALAEFIQRLDAAGGDASR